MVADGVLQTFQESEDHWPLGVSWFLHGQTLNPAYSAFPLPPTHGQAEHRLLITVTFSIIPSLEKSVFKEQIILFDFGI